MSKFCSRWFVAILALIGVLAATQVVSAQGRRGFGRYFAVPANLASLDEVQRDLEMNDEQRTKAGEIYSQLRSDRRNLWQQGPGEDTWQQMDQLNQEATEKVLALLNEPQQNRLLGITVQQMGARALGDPAIVHSLNLDDGQKAKLQEVRASNREAMQNAFMDYSHLSDEERRAKFAQLADEGDEKLMGALTDQQRQHFEDMKGSPIDVDLSPLFPNRGGN